jgi:hypothetical protein
MPTPNDSLQHGALPSPDVTLSMTSTYDVTSPDTKLLPTAYHSCW